jgi:hypothetical protein
MAAKVRTSIVLFRKLLAQPGVELRLHGTVLYNSNHSIGPTGPWRMPHHCARYLDRLPIPSGSRTLDVRRRDRLGGTHHEYRHAA